jgi:hypothetical protein
VSQPLGCFDWRFSALKGWSLFLISKRRSTVKGPFDYQETLFPGEHILPEESIIGCMAKYPPRSGLLEGMMPMCLSPLQGPLLTITSGLLILKFLKGQ